MVIVRIHDEDDEESSLLWKIVVLIKPGKVLPSNVLQRQIQEPLVTQSVNVDRYTMGFGLYITRVRNLLGLLRQIRWFVCDPRAPWWIWILLKVCICTREAPPATGGGRNLGCPTYAQCTLSGRTITICFPVPILYSVEGYSLFHSNVLHPRQRQTHSVWSGRHPYFIFAP